MRSWMAAVVAIIISASLWERRRTRTSDRRTAPCVVPQGADVGQGAGRCRHNQVACVLLASPRYPAALANVGSDFAVKIWSQGVQVLLLELVCAPGTYLIVSACSRSLLLASPHGRLKSKTTASALGQTASGPRNHVKVAVVDVRVATVIFCFIHSADRSSPIRRTIPTSRNGHRRRQARDWVLQLVDLE